MAVGKHAMTAPRVLLGLEHLQPMQQQPDYSMVHDAKVTVPEVRDWRDGKPRASGLAPESRHT